MRGPPRAPVGRGPAPAPKPNINAPKKLVCEKSMEEQLQEWSQKLKKVEKKVAAPKEKTLAE